MTRALFATELDDAAKGPAVDPDMTVDGETRPLPMETDSALEQAAGSGQGQGHGSISAWTDGQATGGWKRRGVFGKIEPGQTLYAKYQVLKKLGGGAMGDVWLVRHVALKSQHALKVIIPNFATNRVALMRFQREFEVMATLRHEHAVTIYDACIDDDGGYIDMEYVEGQTIHDALAAARGRPDPDPSGPLMPLGWIVRVLDQLCEVLQAAHEKGIVHRDLKPSNLMLVGGRKPGKEYLKVLDFGIAKVRDDPEGAAGRDQEENANKTQGFIGTPSYGSPEQAMGLEDVDGRADLYSVGIMLYEFVTGRVPFRGNHWQVMSQNATSPPPSFAEANPRLRPLPEVEHAILRVLAKDRDRRPQAARELFEEFRDAVGAVLPVASPGPTWDAAPFDTPSEGSPTAGSMLPTELDNQAHARPLSTREATLIARPTRTDKARRQSPSDLGAAVDRPSGRSWAGIAAIVGVLLASVAALGFLVYSSKRKDLPIAIGAKPPVHFERYWPETYLPVGGDRQLWPDKVRRTTDEVIFLKFADGIYLPESYEPENRADLVDGWPRVIVREGIRFLRIAGDKEWVMGAWDAPNAVDRADSPPHPIILSGYYIQETEVTNGQLEDFFKWLEISRPTEWEQTHARLKYKVGADVARRHPASSITRKLAVEFADSLAARLPTEAQWEYAARSGGQKRRYVWGDVPPPGRKLANIDPVDDKTTAIVGSYPADRTLQGVLDMTGNVQEMCRDGWESSYRKTVAPVLDPCSSPADPSKPEYSIRGAGFDSLAADCAITRRDGKCSATDAVENLGFRLVVECPDTRKPR